MSLLTRLRSWMRASLHREVLEDRMQAEMETPLALYEADLRRTGVPEQEARRQARAAFGAAAARKDECREALGLRIVDELRADVTYAFRLLRRSPAFTIVALSSLGLGIGANTAIFTLVDSVMMRMLPVDDPKTLSSSTIPAASRAAAAALPTHATNCSAIGDRYSVGAAACGTRNVFFTYAMLARVSATISLFGDPVSSTYHPR
jgi:hypothetical protein